MRAPYFKIYVAKNNREISGFIESFKFEDCVGEDNLLTLDVNRDYARTIADDDDFVTGVIFNFQFGVMGEQLSKTHSARVTDIDYVYEDKVTMKIKCLDLGTVVKKDESQKIWENMTSSQIAQEIASKYGMEAEIQATSKVWDAMPQGNRTDMAFLKYLAGREADGNYITYIRDNILYFSKRGIERPSGITYTYNYGKGPVISFRPSLKESGAAGSMNKAIMTGSDVQVTPQNEAKGGTTGAYRKYYGETGEFAGKIPAKAGTDKPEIKKHIVDPSRDKSEISNIANTHKKKSTLKADTATLEIDGNPLLMPNTVLTMRNVAKRHEGNWWVEKVAHSINGQGYITTATLNRNGSKKIGSATKAPDANTTVGDKKLKQSVSLRTYSGETGEFRGYSSELRD